MTMDASKCVLYLLSTGFHSLKHRLFHKPNRVRTSLQTVHHTCASKMASEGEVKSTERQNQGVGSKTRMFHKSLMMGYKLSVSDDHTVATVHLNGLSVDGFDRDGNPRTTYLLHIVSSLRFFAYNEPIDQSDRKFLEYVRMRRDSLIYVISNELEVHSAMYDKSVPKQPLACRFQLGYVGTSSLNTVGVLTAPSIGQELLRMKSQVVRVNKNTRRPMPLPDWWREKYASVAIGNPALIVKRHLRPAVTHVFPVTVTWSETDNNEHTTWTAYAHFCTNAVRDAVRTSFYKNITSEVLQKGLRKIRMGFLSESAETDKLIVHSWESVDDDTTVCCEIENLAGQCLFHATLRYPNLSGKV